jgi:hypothetical protein
VLVMVVEVWHASPTAVDNGGKLKLSGNISTSASLTVNASTLDLTGTAPATTFTGTSQLASYDTGSPSTSSVGNVSGNLTLTSGTTYKANVGASNASSKIAVTGNITLGSAPCTINNPTTGVFTVMTYTGTLSGTFGTITATGHTATATYTGGNVIVTVV